MKEIVASITNKDQVTIPLEVREHLGLGKLEKIAFVIDEQGDVHLQTPHNPTAVQLHAVRYKYPHSERLALSDVSYTFGTGTTAIVGPNGAGKSTLVKLLTGLLTPTSGSIRARLPGGEELPLEKLPKAVLLQEPSHLHLTIRQNVTMCFERTPNEDARIYDALDKAGLGKVVKGLPDGIDTLVGAGFGGQTDLSGGQWQRLALARLIYQDAPMMILDEPVASLDPEGERAVFELCSQGAQDKVIIFTTHRYDSIPTNTRIVVLVDGLITESGTHDELVQMQRDYWSLYITGGRPLLGPQQVPPQQPVRRPPGTTDEGAILPQIEALQPVVKAGSGDGRRPPRQHGDP